MNGGRGGILYGPTGGTRYNAAAIGFGGKPGPLGPRYIGPGGKGGRGWLVDDGCVGSLGEGNLLGSTTPASLDLSLLALGLPARSMLPTDFVTDVKLFGFPAPCCCCCCCW